VTGFGSFNNSAGKRVLNVLEAGNLTLKWVVVKRIAVIKFEVNNGGGNGASCGGIKVKTDITKPSNMVIASFGDGQHLVEKVTCSSKMHPRLRAGWVVLSEELCIWSSCFLSPLSMNSVLEEVGPIEAYISETTQEG